MPSIVAVIILVKILQTPATLLPTGASIFPLTAPLTMFAHRAGAGASRSLVAVGHPAVGCQPQTREGKRGPAGILREALEARTIVGRDVRGGVQRQALEEDALPLIDADIAVAVGRTTGHDGSGLRGDESVARATVLAVGVEQRQDTADDAEEDRRDVLVLRGSSS